LQVPERRQQLNDGAWNGTNTFSSRHDGVLLKGNDIRYHSKDVSLVPTFERVPLTQTMVENQAPIISVRFSHTLTLLHSTPSSVI
jgi:hypothetical protein